MEGRRTSAQVKNDPVPRLSLGSHLFRRTMHMGSCLLVVYYLLPHTILFVPRQIWLILLLGLVPLTIEFIRLQKKKVIIGQRPHETVAVGSYAWSAWASMVIMLVMPQQVAIPVIVIYSFADPVLSELRAWKKWTAFPFGFIFIWIMFLAFGFNVALAGYGALFMIIGESTELKGVLRIRPELANLYNVEDDAMNWRFKFKTDDDGSTQIIPAIFLGIAFLGSYDIFPGPWLFPIM